MRCQRKDKPSPPCNLQVVKVCTDYVCVKWQAPMSDGNSPITCYVVEKADASTRTFTNAGHTNSDTCKFKVSQLNKGKPYLIRVFAENAMGHSEPVSLQEPVQLPLEPSPPCNLHMVDVCTDYVCVTWQAPMSDGNSPITRYVVEKADASTRTFTIAGHTDSDTQEFKVNQLNKGKPYLIRVFAENAIGQSEPVSLEEPVRLPHEPSPPCNLQVVGVCTDYVCVTWQVPVSDGNSPITGYVVDKADASTCAFSIAGHTNSDTQEFRVSQLNKGKPYLIRVFAENVIGQSEPVSLQEPVRLPLEPSPPRNLEVVKVCTDYICVTWQAPVSDGNSPITSYVVEKADASTPTFTIAGHTDSDTQEFKVSRLNRGKQYLIRVFAKNAIGQSEPVSLEEPVELLLGECVMHLSCFVV
ncbi:Titin [Lamellibrachia satsuma]|nr:Titin [Lamellibrachia satsuma]